MRPHTGSKIPPRRSGRPPGQSENGSPGREQRRLGHLTGASLTEYGEVMQQGRAGMRRGVADALERVSERLPAMVIDTLREQWARIGQLDEEIDEIERRIGAWHRGNADSKRIAEIPGVGVLTATAVAAAAMGSRLAGIVLSPAR